MKQLLLSVVLALGLLQSAQAMEVTFNFNAYSSGADIYPCNAGIFHATGSSPGCLLLNTTTPCNSGDPGCVCGGGNAQDRYHDFAMATVTNWDLTGTPVVVTAHAYSHVEFGYPNSVVADRTDFSHRITNLSFNLGSEAYGAQYYVDICYRGPQIDYWQNDVGVNMVLNGSTTFTDLAGLSSGTANTYLGLAGLSLSVSVACDLQGLGDNFTAAGVGGYDSLSTDMLLLPWAMGAGSDYQTGAQGLPITATGTTSVFQNLPLSQTVPSPTGTTVASNGVPRFCKVRYAFAESEGLLRSWNIHGATVQTFTQIQAN